MQPFLLICPVLPFPFLSTARHCQAAGKPAWVNGLVPAGLLCSKIRSNIPKAGKGGAITAEQTGNSMKIIISFTGSGVLLQ
jgi:hypothetical protein